MGHRLQPRHEPMRRPKVFAGAMLYNGSATHAEAAFDHAAEIQHAAHSLSGLGQVAVSICCFVLSLL